MDGFLNPNQYCPVSHETCRVTVNDKLSLMEYLNSLGRGRGRGATAIDSTKYFSGFSHPARVVLHSGLGITFSAPKLIGGFR